MAIDLLIIRTDIIHEKLNKDYISIFIKNPNDPNPNDPNPRSIGWSLMSKGGMMEFLLRKAQQNIKQQCK